mmetsp:Transcript_4045/g.7870  ORF Transcript_4045/g.7870 Transcript_4045/m.7870 type:complete len:235 (-) Transcript_4045:97-801(-)
MKMNTSGVSDEATPERVCGAPADMAYRITWGGPCIEPAREVGGRVLCNIQWSALSRRPVSACPGSEARVVRSRARTQSISARQDLLERGGRHRCTLRRTDTAACRKDVAARRQAHRAQERRGEQHCIRRVHKSGQPWLDRARQAVRVVLCFGGAHEKEEQIGGHERPAGPQDTGRAGRPHHPHEAEDLAEQMDPHDIIPALREALLADRDPIDACKRALGSAVPSIVDDRQIER